MRKFLEPIQKPSSPNEEQLKQSILSIEKRLSRLQKSPSYSEISLDRLDSTKRSQSLKYQRKSASFKNLQ